MISHKERIKLTLLKFLRKLYNMLEGDAGTRAGLATLLPPLKQTQTQIYFTTMTELSIHHYTKTCDTYINNSGRCP